MKGPSSAEVVEVAADGCQYISEITILQEHFVN